MIVDLAKVLTETYECGGRELGASRGDGAIDRARAILANDSGSSDSLLAPPKGEPGKQRRSGPCAACGHEANYLLALADVMSGKDKIRREWCCCQHCEAFLRGESKTHRGDAERTRKLETSTQRWPTSDEGRTHDRLTSIVDNNLGPRPTAPIDRLLDDLEEELPAIVADAEKWRKYCEDLAEQPE